MCIIRGTYVVVRLTPPKTATRSLWRWILFPPWWKESDAHIRFVRACWIRSIFVDARCPCRFRVERRCKQAKDKSIPLVRQWIFSLEFVRSLKYPTYSSQHCGIACAKKTEVRSEVGTNNGNSFHIRLVNLTELSFQTWNVEHVELNVECYRNVACTAPLIVRGKLTDPT